MRAHDGITFLCSFSHSSLLHPSFLLFLPTGIMDAAQRRMASLAAHVSAPQVRVSSERAKRREKLNGEEKRRRHRRRRRLASEVLMQSALIRLWFQHTIPAFSCPIHRPRHQKYMHSSRPRKKERETKASPLFLELIDNNQTKKNGKTDRRRPRCHRSDLFFSVRRWRLQGRAPGRRRRHRPAPRPAAEAVSAWCVVGEEQRKRENDSALTSSSSSHLKTLTRYPNLLLLHLARPPSPTSHSTTSSAPRASARTSAT
jgi:hypothetical protein